MTQYKLVPVEPTEEMLQRGASSVEWDEYMTKEGVRELLLVVFKAMLAAAPADETIEQLAAELKRRIEQPSEREKELVRTCRELLANTNGLFMLGNDYRNLGHALAAYEGEKE